MKHKTKFPRETFNNLIQNDPEQLYQLLNQLLEISEQVKILTEKVIWQENRIKELESQLKKNSNNSNKPPSSDGLKKKSTIKSLRKKGNKPSGGQKGHKGNFLKMNPSPDEITIIKLENCKNCGTSLEKQNLIDVDKRQVIDIEIKTITEEFQAEIKNCPCCNTSNTAIFPEHINTKVQYGHSLKTFLIYLRNYNLIPFERLKQICMDVFNIHISEGTIINTVKNFSNKISPFDNWLKEKLLNQELLHFDESGIRIEGKLHWVHNVSNNLYTYYFAHKKRGVEAMNDMGILPLFNGFAIHDYWKSYLNYDCKHGLCNEHHLRELLFFYEEKKQNWAGKMIDLLYKIKHEVTAKKIEGQLLSKNRTFYFEKKYYGIIEKGLSENPYPENDIKKRGRKKKGKIINLLERFKNNIDQVLAFMYHFIVPFSNNQAERDIRMVKVQQKISGCFRTMDGAKDFFIIRSFISTIKKHKINILEAIEKVYKNNQISAIIAE